MATYAIGDVQGCFTALQGLLHLIKFNKEQDTLWFAGDLVNRGPESLQTLRFIKSLKKAVVVLGNHDLHLIAVYYGFKALYPDDTISEILAAAECEELIEWLCQQHLAYYDPKFEVFMVHAGVAPTWSPKQALSLAQEIEQALRGATRQDFLKNMYGNEPDCWQNSLTSFARLRVITNYLTRMRFCNEKGRLIFTKNTAPSNCPEGFMPWFKVPNRQMQNQKIVFGHWSVLQGQTHEPHAYALDTGVVWGGPLTALRLEDFKRFSFLLNQ